MDFALSADLIAYLAELDDFIEARIKPLEMEDDNIRFFDHRREHARTDWDNNGLPRREWEALLAKARKAQRLAVKSSDRQLTKSPCRMPRRRGFQRLHRHVHAERVRAATDNHAAQWRDIAKVAAPGERDMILLHAQIIGRIKLNPSKGRREHRYPGM